MEIMRLTLVLCFTCTCLAGKHIIPIEDYKTELEDLGSHVEYKDIPIKIIKITKTVAVKVPVPYPVKVIEKVPYPVHVSKPYPVPVPHIVKVPQPAPSHHTKPQEHHPLGHSDIQYKPEEHSYHSDEHPTGEYSEGNSFADYGGHSIHTLGNEHDFGGSYHQPTHSLSGRDEEPKDHQYK